MIRNKRQLALYFAGHPDERRMQWEVLPLTRGWLLRCDETNYHTPRELAAMRRAWLPVVHLVEVGPTLGRQVIRALRGAETRTMDTILRNL